jgi:hypothetical protein
VLSIDEATDTGLAWKDAASSADAVTFEPVGTLEATNVQAAIEELLAEGGSAGGGGGGHIIYDEAVQLPQQAGLDFIGPGVTVSDDPVTGKTVVNVTGTTPTASAFTRQTASITTASLTNGASHLGVIPLAAGYRLYAISTSRPARVRLYDTTFNRDGDLGRPAASPPDLNDGLMLDFVTTSGTLAASLSPLVDGYVPSGTDVPISVVNLGTPGTITVTLTYVRTE